MNLFYNLLLVTCVFATTQHVAFSVQAQDSQPLKILMITLSPPGPIQVGTEVNATARIYSSLEEPVCQWMVFGGQKKVLKGELTDMSENEYESTVSLGPIRRTSDVFLHVSNSYGEETKRIQIDFAAKFGERCKTSEQCLLVTNNSECDQDKCLLVTNDTECDPQKKRCFCEPGYGIDDEEDNKTCKEYPFRKVKTLTIGEGIDMACRIAVANFSEINWFRNGTICTYGSSCSQDKETIYYEEIISYQRRLSLQNVITSNTYMYTCQATTTDGRNWTVLETTITVDPVFETTEYLTTGSNYSVLCDLQSSGLEIRLARDGKDFCTPNVTWCLKHNSTKEASYYDRDQWYDVLNLRANHTFTCEAITGEEKSAIVMVYHYIIGEKPKILEVTFSPPGTAPKGTEVVATARIHSPLGKPNRKWKLSYNGTEHHGLEENLTLVSENTYESSVSLGPIRPFNSISFEVSNIFGRDNEYKFVIVAVEYGDWCDIRKTVCATNNTECDKFRHGSCICRQRYFWDYGKKICQRTTYQTFGEDRNISCSVTTPNLQVRLVRDGIESCTPGAAWCSEVNDTWAIQKSTRIFTVLNQRANSTYTCEAYSGDGKFTTVQVYHLVIDPRPKILVLTHSPVQENTEVVATARFFSPDGEPYVYWALNIYNPGLNWELSVLAENIYESKVSLGTINRSSELLLSVRNTHGEDIEKIEVKPSGGAVQKGGISMIALTIIITLFRSTTLTVC